MNFKGIIRDREFKRQKKICSKRGRERGREGEKRKEGRQIVSYWLRYQDLGFCQLFLGWVIIFIFAIEDNLKWDLVSFYSKVLFV